MLSTGQQTVTEGLTVWVAQGNPDWLSLRYRQTSMVRGALLSLPRVQGWIVRGLTLNYDRTNLRALERAQRPARCRGRKKCGPPVRSPV